MKTHQILVDLRSQHDRIESRLDEMLLEQRVRRKWFPEVWQTAFVFFFSFLSATVLNFLTAPGTSQWELARQANVLLAWTLFFTALSGLLWWNACHRIRKELAAR